MVAFQGRPTFTGAAASVPRGVAEPLIFQYTDGVKFVAQAYQRGGWKAVDKLYSDPPQSTQGWPPKVGNGRKAQ